METQLVVPPSGRKRLTSSNGSASNACGLKAGLLIDFPRRRPMPNSHKSKNISRDTENVNLAKKIIAGRDEAFDIMFDLAKKLKNERAFGYARRILERARGKPEANHPDIRLKLAQQLALV